MAWNMYWLRKNEIYFFMQFCNEFANCTDMHAFRTKSVSYVLACAFDVTRWKAITL